MSWTKLYTSIWNDKKFCALSEGAGFLFLYYFSGPFRNALGIYRVLDRNICGQFQLDPEKLRSRRQELIDADMIEWDAESDVVWVKKFLKWNFINNENQAKGMTKDKILSTVPIKSPLFPKFLKAIQEPDIRLRGQNDVLVSIILEKLSPRPPVTKPPDPNAPFRLESEPADDGLGFDSKRLIEMWNSICGENGFAKVREIQAGRLDKARKRLKEKPLPYWKSVFETMIRSAFLLGENQNEWKATYDWIVNNDLNHAKVMEGHYSRGENVNKPKRGMDAIKSLLEKGKNNDPGSLPSGDGDTDAGV